MKIVKGVVCVVMLVAASSAMGDLFTFTNLTNNVSQNLTGQLLVDVTSAGPGQVAFKFTNNVGIASNVSEVYFADGTLLSLASISSSAGVNFGSPANPADLPGGQNASPPFNATFSAQAGNPSPQNGLNDASDFVTITFNLLNGQTFADEI